MGGGSGLQFFLNPLCALAFCLLVCFSCVLVGILFPTEGVPIAETRNNLWVISQPPHPPPPTISRFRAKLFLVWRIPVNRQNPTNPSQSSTPYDQAIKKQSVGPPMGSNNNLKCECCEAILTQIWSRAEKVNRAIVGKMSNNMHCWANVGHCWANPMLANQTGRLWDLRGPLISRREEIWQKSSYDLALTFSI